MLPRNFSARVVVIFCIVILAVVSIHFSDHAAATQIGRFGYCASTPDQSSVYFSEVFDTGLDPSFTSDTTPIANEYNEYLKGRFDFKTTSYNAVGCRTPCRIVSATD